MDFLTHIYSIYVQFSFSLTYNPRDHLPTERESIFYRLTPRVRARLLQWVVVVHEDLTGRVPNQSE